MFIVCGGMIFNVPYTILMGVIGSWGLNPGEPCKSGKDIFKIMAVVLIFQKYPFLHRERIQS